VLSIYHEDFSGVNFVFTKKNFALHNHAKDRWRHATQHQEEKSRHYFLSSVLAGMILAPRFRPLGKSWRRTLESLWQEKIPKIKSQINFLARYLHQDLDSRRSLLKECPDNHQQETAKQEKQPWSRYKEPNTHKTFTAKTQHTLDIS
jgi:hypothetical protein